MAITWKNVNQASEARNAAALIQGAQNSFDSGFEAANQFVADRRKRQNANWENTRDNNTQAMLDRIAGAGTPEGFADTRQGVEQMQQQAGSQYDPVAVRKALMQRPEQLREATRQQNEFTDENVARDYREDVANAYSLSQQGKRDEALAAVPKDHPQYQEIVDNIRSGVDSFGNNQRAWAENTRQDRQQINRNQSQANANQRQANANATFQRQKELWGREDETYFDNKAMEDATRKLTSEWTERTGSSIDAGRQIAQKYGVLGPNGTISQTEYSRLSKNEQAQLDAEMEQAQGMTATQMRQQDVKTLMDDYDLTNKQANQVLGQVEQNFSTNRGLSQLDQKRVDSAMATARRKAGISLDNPYLEPESYSVGQLVKEIGEEDNDGDGEGDGYGGNADGRAQLFALLRKAANNGVAMVDGDSTTIVRPTKGVIQDVLRSYRDTDGWDSQKDAADLLKKAMRNSGALQSYKGARDYQRFMKNEQSRIEASVGGGNDFFGDWQNVSDRYR